MIVKSKNKNRFSDYINSFQFSKSPCQNELSPINKNSKSILSKNFLSKNSVNNTKKMNIEAILLEILLKINNIYSPNPSFNMNFKLLKVVKVKVVYNFIESFISVFYSDSLPKLLVETIQKYCKTNKIIVFKSIFELICYSNKTYNLSLTTFDAHLYKDNKKIEDFCEIPDHEFKIKLIPRDNYISFSNYLSSVPKISYKSERLVKGLSCKANSVQDIGMSYSNKRIRDSLIFSQNFQTKKKPLISSQNLKFFTIKKSLINQPKITTTTTTKTLSSQNLLSPVNNYIIKPLSLYINSDKSGKNNNLSNNVAPKINSTIDFKQYYSIYSSIKPKEMIYSPSVKLIKHFHSNKSKNSRIFTINSKEIETSKNFQNNFVRRIMNSKQKERDNSHILFPIKKIFEKDLNKMIKSFYDFSPFYKTGKLKPTSEEITHFADKGKILTSLLIKKIYNESINPKFIEKIKNVFFKDLKLISFQEFVPFYLYFIEKNKNSAYDMEMKSWIKRNTHDIYLINYLTNYK